MWSWSDLDPVGAFSFMPHQQEAAAARVSRQLLAEHVALGAVALLPVALLAAQTLLVQGVEGMRQREGATSLHILKDTEN